MAYDPTPRTATIANGASLSNAVKLGRGGVGALALPSGWTTAALTFQGSVDDGVSYQNIYDDGTERTIASASVAASRTLSLDPEDWVGFTHIKVRSGTAGSPVNQGADRAIVVSLDWGH
jgi:hypothetical protein